MRDYESPEKIEREIEQTRAEISHTITALRQRLSPGTLLNQALASAKGGGAEFASNLGRTVRDNPIPVFLTGVGLTWLMLSGRDGGHYAPEARHIYREDSNRVPLSPAAETTTTTEASRGAAEATKAAVGAARAKVEGWTDQARSQAQQTTEKVKGTTADLRARAQRASEGVRERANIAYRRTADTAQYTRARVGEAAGSVGHIIKEYPIVVGALAVAFGAGLAMLIPSTRREGELMGEASDAVRATAKEKAIEVKETVAEQASKVGSVATAAAGAAIDTAREEAERQHLMSKSSQQPEATESSAKASEKAAPGSSRGPSSAASGSTSEKAASASEPASGRSSVETRGAPPGTDVEKPPKPGSESGDMPAIPGYTRGDPARGK